MERQDRQNITAWEMEHFMAEIRFWRFRSPPRATPTAAPPIQIPAAPCRCHGSSASRPNPPSALLQIEVKILLLHPLPPLPKCPNHLRLLVQAERRLHQAESCPTPVTRAGSNISRSHPGQGLGQGQRQRRVRKRWRWRRALEAPIVPRVPFGIPSPPNLCGSSTEERRQAEGCPVAPPRQLPLTPPAGPLRLPPLPPFQLATAAGRAPVVPAGQ